MWSQVSDPVAAEFSLNTQMILLSKRMLWLSDGSMGFGQESDTAFSQGRNNNKQEATKESTKKLLNLNKACKCNLFLSSPDSFPLFVSKEFAAWLILLLSIFPVILQYKNRKIKKKIGLDELAYDIFCVLSISSLFPKAVCFTLQKDLSGLWKLSRLPRLFIIINLINCFFKCIPQVCAIVNCCMRLTVTRKTWSSLLRRCNLWPGDGGSGAELGWLLHLQHRESVSLHRNWWICSQIQPQQFWIRLSGWCSVTSLQIQDHCKQHTCLYRHVYPSCSRMCVNSNLRIQSSHCRTRPSRRLRPGHLAT